MHWNEPHRREDTLTVFWVASHLGTSSNSFGWPAVQGDKLQGSIEDTSLKLLLRFVLLILLSILVLVTWSHTHKHWQTDNAFFANVCTHTNIFSSTNHLLNLQVDAVQRCCHHNRLLFLDRPGVGSGSFPGSRVRHGVGCSSVVFRRVSLVVFTGAGGRGGRRGVRFGFILEPCSGTVQPSAQADVMRDCWCRGRWHCKGKWLEILLDRVHSDQTCHGRDVCCQQHWNQLTNL